jgi:hypothetical protein
MKMNLFHAIDTNPAENASVRKFIFDNGLKDQIEFHNVSYASSQKLLKDLGGEGRTPCLVAGAKILVGAQTIIDFLNSERSE